jgi:hypothetical protein
VTSSQKWAFFTTRIIYGDLMKVQQRLMNNYSSGQIQLRIYFIFTYEQDTSSHAKFQIKIIYE